MTRRTRTTLHLQESALSMPDSQAARLRRRLRRLQERPGILGDGVRFALMSGINAVISFVAFQVYFLFLPHALAYAAMWITSLVYVVLVYPRFVYRAERAGRPKSTAFAIAYVAIFVAGLGALEALVYLGIPARVGVLGAMMTTTLLNFTIGRLIFASRDRTGS